MGPGRQGIRRADEIRDAALSPLLFACRTALYSARVPESAIALRIFSDCSLMYTPSSSGVLPRGSVPKPRRRLRKSDVFSAFASSPLIFWMMGCGVPAGATRLYQPMNSYPGTVSEIGGTSGTSGERVVLVWDRQGRIQFASPVVVDTSGTLVIVDRRSLAARVLESGGVEPAPGGVGAPTVRAGEGVGGQGDGVGDGAGVAVGGGARGVGWVGEEEGADVVAGVAALTERGVSLLCALTVAEHSRKQWFSVSCCFHSPVYLVVYSIKNAGNLMPALKT